MASSVIGALRVVLGLDAAQFEKGADKAKSSLSTMRKQFLGVAGAAAAAGTALVAAALKSAGEIDRLAKAGRRVETGVGGFRALELAASESGVSVSALADSVQTMDREIAKGSKGATAALDRLGLAAGDLAGLEADQKLALVGDRIKALGLSSGETTALLQGLGIRQRDLVLLLQAGGDGLRQARTDVEDYGLALDAVEAGKIETANDRLARLGLISQYVGQQLAVTIVPALGQMAQAMTNSLREGGALRIVIDALVGNLDLLVNTAGVAVAALGARYVGAVISARLATFTLTGALKGLRVALMSLGIPALIIGAGVLVTWFTRLVTSAGGFGEALALLRDVASEVWSRIGIGLQAAGSTINGVWQEIKAIGLEVFAGILTGGVEFGNRYIGIYRGAFEAVKAIWSALPAAIGDMAIGAANALIGGVESMLNAVSERINKFIGMVNDALALLPDWATGGEPIAIGAVGRIDLGGIENPFAGAARDAGAAAKEAFMQGFNQDTFTAPDTSAITGMADAARDSAETARLAARTLGTLATDPLKSWGALREVMGETATATDDAAAAAAALGQEIDALDGAGGGGGGGGSKGAKSKLDSVKDKVKEIATEASSAAQTIQGTFTDAFKGIVKEGQTLGQALGSILQKLGDMALDSLGSWLFGGISKSLGGLFAGSIPGFANGTDSAPGGLAWVGERGPELVNLPRGSQVIPNHQLGGLRGEPAEVVVRLAHDDLILTDKGEVMTRVRLEQQQAVPEIVRQSVKATRESAKKFPIR